MNKKNIQIAVVIICFAGAGFVLYRGFNGASSDTQPAPTNVPAAGSSQTPGGNSSMAGAGPVAAGSSKVGPAVEVVSGDKILPYGESFDVEKIFKDYKFQFGAYTYPKLNTTTEVGLEVNTIIKPEENNSNRP